MHPQNIHRENPDSKYSPNVCKRDQTCQIDRILKRDQTCQILENLALREIGFGWWFESHLTGSNLTNSDLPGQLISWDQTYQFSLSHGTKPAKSAHFIGSNLSNQLISWDQTSSFHGTKPVKSISWDQTCQVSSSHGTKPVKSSHLIGPNLPSQLISWDKICQVSSSHGTKSVKSAHFMGPNLSNRRTTLPCGFILVYWVNELYWT